MVVEPCPRCESPLRTHACVNGAEDTPVETDALTVCVHCGEVLRYDKNLRPRRVTKQEFRELPHHIQLQVFVVSQLFKGRRE